MSTTEKILMLNGKNFQAWKQVITAHLDYKGCLDFLLREPQNEEQLKKEKQALFILKSSIEPLELVKTGDCLTAKDLWRKLTENYQGSRATQEGTVSAEWASFGPKPNEDLFSYCGRFEQILAKLDMVEYKVPEDQKFYFFLRGLPESRREFCFTWKQCNPKAEIQELVSAIKIRHHTDGLIKTRDTSVAMVMSEPLTSKQPAKKPASPKKPQEATAPNAPTNTQQQMVGGSSKTCAHCGLKGHLWKSCFRLREKYDGESFNKPTKGPSQAPKEPAKDPAKELIMMTAEAFPEAVGADTWIADSGASSHVTSFRQILTDFVEFSEPKEIITGGSSRYAIGSGDYHFLHNGRQGRLTDVLLIPDFPLNLISLVKLTDKGYKVEMGEEKPIVVKIGLETVLSGVKEGNLLCFSMPTRRRPHYNEAIYLEVPLNEWHLRFGHTPVNKLKEMHANQSVLKFGVSRTPRQEQLCVDCLTGKNCRKPHPCRNRLTRNEAFTGLHADTCGPISVTSITGAKYFVVMVDDQSNYLFVETVASKTEISDKVKLVIVKIQSESNRTVAFLQTDNGTEFVNSDLRSWLASRGIAHDLSCAYTPQQNGSAERAIRTIVEGARCQILSSGLPKFLWSESIKAAAYALNRVTGPRDKTKTRFELFYGHKPDVSNLRVFGQNAIIRIDHPGLGKFDRKGVQAKFVGYTERFNTYLLYVPSSKKLVSSCNVNFLPLDQEFPKTKEHPQLQNRFAEFPDDKEITWGPVEVHEVSYLDPDSNDSQEDEVDQKLDTSLNDMSIEEFHEPLAELSEEESVSEHQVPSINEQIHQEIDARNGRDTSQTTGPITRSQARASSLVPIFQKLDFKGKPVQNNDHVLFTLEQEPQTVAEAKRRPDWPKWQAAINEELNAHSSNGTWELVPRQKGRRTIRSRWVFRLKKNPDGSIAKHKARLVAKGYSQVPGIDFQETYAPVAALSLVRLLICYALKFCLKLFQLDVTTAFLNGDLEEDIFMEVPEEVEAPLNYVCLLRKSLYGLKQAPLRWNVKLDSILTSIGFEKSTFDDCLYLSKKKNIAMIVYVDDVLIACKSRNEFELLTAELSRHVKLTTSEAKIFLGLQIEKSADGNAIKLHQKHYVEQVLSRFGMLDCNPCDTPQATGPFDVTNSPTSEDPNFREMVGSLYYLAYATRPDILSAVGVASRTNSPTQAHLQLLRRVLRYVSGTKDLGIVFSRDSRETLVAYSDADFANDLQTRRSITGYIVLHYGPIAWTSSRQRIVALSSTEAEYISGCELAKELVPLRNISLELNLIQEQPTEVLIDNISTIRLSDNLKSRQRTKHIDVRERYLSQQVDDKAIKVSHVSGEHQLADIFTKPLPKPRFQSLRARIMVLASFVIMIAVQTTAAPSGLFTEVSPIYYTKSKFVYVNGLVMHHVTLDIVNRCKTYFENVTIDATVNSRLQAECDTQFYENTRGRLDNVLARDPKAKAMTNRPARSVGAEVILSYFVFSGVSNYKIFEGPDSKANVQEVASKLKTHEEALKLATSSLNSVRDHLKGLDAKVATNTFNIAFLNETIQGFPKIMALVVDASNYHRDLSVSLKAINRDLGRNKISATLKTLTGEELWSAGAEEWSEVRSANYKSITGGFRFSTEFSVPTIDTAADILEVVSFKFWNTTATKMCRVKYAGPRFVLSNHTNGCLSDVDSDWINYGTLEGHPCLVEADETGKPRSVKLHELKSPFHEEVCTETFKPDVGDIQLKRLNGFMRIYCYGHAIIVRSTNTTCPRFVFELPLTEEFILNGHTHRASAKQTVLMNPHELHVNREITKQLAIGSIKIGGNNYTMLDKGIDKLNQLADKLGLPEKARISVPSWRPAVLLGMWHTGVGLWKSAWLAVFQPIFDFLKTVLWIGLGLLALVALTTFSPFLQLAFNVLRPSLRTVSRISSNMKTQRALNLSKQRIV